MVNKPPDGTGGQHSLSFSCSLYVAGFADRMTASGSYTPWAARPSCLTRLMIEFASDTTPLTPSESIAKVIAILGSGIRPFVLDGPRCPEIDKPRQCSALQLDLVRGLVGSPI